VAWGQPRVFFRRVRTWRRVGSGQRCASCDLARRSNACFDPGPRKAIATFVGTRPASSPVARRNARVELDCEENRQSRAISESDADSNLFCRPSFDDR
jgi:hypothetical protein